MKRYAVSFITIIILLVGLIFWNIGSGSISISWDELWNILLKQTEEGTAYHIIWDIRLPRILAAVMLGGALSISGFLLQTFFGNPIAGPYVLGISSGAKLMVALAMIYLLGRGNYNQFFWNGSSSLCRLTSGNGICTFNFHEGT